MSKEQKNTEKQSGNKVLIMMLFVIGVAVTVIMNVVGFLFETFIFGK